MFEENEIKEFLEWKNINNENFTWWSFVNMKADLPTALAFAKFFNPEIIEINNCFFLKDNFSVKRYEMWKENCGHDKTALEKMMNLYQLRDFFHINNDYQEDEDGLVSILGDVLLYFWSLNLKHKYPDKNFIVSVFEDDNDLFITVYLERS